MLQRAVPRTNRVEASDAAAEILGRQDLAGIPVRRDAQRSSQAAPPRARRQSIMASSNSSRSCATCRLSISRASPRAAGAADERASLRLRARGDRAGPALGRGGRRGRPRPARRPGRRGGGHPRSRRPAGRARRFEGALRSEARRAAARHFRQGDQRLDRVRQRRGNRPSTTSGARLCAPWRGLFGRSASGRIWR